MKDEAINEAWQAICELCLVNVNDEDEIKLILEILYTQGERDELIRQTRAIG
jgi:Trp operon repressor